MTLPAVRLRSGLRILHADNHVLVVDKPAGLWATGPRDSVLTIVADHLLAAHGTRFAAAAHRLDRPVSGAMLVARTRKAAGRIAAAFRARAVRKEYFAVVEMGATEASPPPDRTTTPTA